MVRYDRGRVLEWYRNGPFGLEQGFTVESRPRAVDGRLTLALTVGGPVRLVQQGSDIAFNAASGETVLRYTGLRAVDASGRNLRATVSSSGSRLLLRVWDRSARYPVRIDPLIQQGSKLTGTGEAGNGGFGTSVALSGDGNTAVIGARGDNNAVGAAWVFTRSGSTWTPQGPKLVPSDATSSAFFGSSVALSADGSTALIGGPGDTNIDGAGWVFTRSGSTWTQQGPKLTVSSETGAKRQLGTSVALSADGNTALLGGWNVNTVGFGAAAVFTRSGSTWTQQGPELTPPGQGTFGYSVALSDDGNTAVLGDPVGGGVWVFTRAGSTWTQQGPVLTANDEKGPSQDFGISVALAGDGNTALIGGEADNTFAGAAWVFTRYGSTWSQQGSKLTASDETGEGGFGNSVALSDDGKIALVGGYADTSNNGAAWLFSRSGPNWVQLGSKVTGTDATSNGYFGDSVTLSDDGTTALIGARNDNGGIGAAWAFVSARISNPPNLSFGSQTTGHPGPVLWLQVQSSGQVPAAVTGPAAISPAAEFAIPSGDDLCDGTTLPPGQSCWIGVRFTATGIGPRTATLSLGPNNAETPSATIALTGTGVAPNSDPAGPAGQTGPAGPPGKNGSQGPPGKNGLVELVTCKTIKHIALKTIDGKPKHVTSTYQACTTKTVVDPVKFITGSRARAVLSRNGVVYATGTAARASRAPQLVLNASRTLSAGTYTLTLRWAVGRAEHTTRQAIALL